MSEQPPKNDNTQSGDDASFSEDKMEEVDQNIAKINSFAGGLDQVEKNLKTDLSKIVAANAEILQSTEEFKKAEADAQTRANALEEAFNNLSSEIGTAETAVSATQDIITKLKDIQTSAHDHRASVENDISAIAQAKSNFETLNNETQDVAEELKQEQESLKKVLTSVQGDHARITQYGSELLDDKEDSEGNKIPSIKTQITTIQDQSTDKLKEINKYHALTQTRFDTLERDLTQKINGLLPQAGAAGLASAYFDSKSRYGVAQFSTNNSEWYKVAPAWVWHHISSTIRHSVNYIFFITPLFGIAWLFLGMPFNHEEIQSGLQGLKELTVEQLPARFTLSIPFALISWFGFSSIQLNRRLYEEYNYKQRVMQTYHSFEKEIDETNNIELKESLLKIMLSVVNFKPSSTMREHQKDPATKLLDVLNLFKKQGE